MQGLRWSRRLARDTTVEGNGSRPGSLRELGVTLSEQICCLLQFGDRRGEHAVVPRETGKLCDAYFSDDDLGFATIAEGIAITEMSAEGSGWQSCACNAGK